MAATELTAEQSRLRNIEAMGNELGAIYSQLWQELAWLYRTWAEYVALFGTKESRVTLLNTAAPAFTRIVQDSLWEGTILHIARLTDSPMTGREKKKNLSIRALEAVIPDSELKVTVSAAVQASLEASSFCRDWRNRHIAHRDLDLALGLGAEPLTPASRLMMNNALESLSAVLNLLSLKYFDSTTFFDLDLRTGGGSGGAMSLLYYIDMGTHAEHARHERLKNGVYNPDDYHPQHL